MKNVLSWLVVQIFQNTFTLNWYRLWLKYEKLKLYPYTLGLHQLENVIIIVDVLLSCSCNSFVELWHVLSILTFF
jgi:hypothetical protein